MKRIHVIAGAVCRDGHVLIAQRPPGSHLAGGWEFPGGKLEPGEQDYACLVREIKEELGIDVHQACYLCAHEHVYADRAIHLKFWVVTHFSGDPQGCEGQAWRWQPLDTLAQVDMLPADEPLVRSLLVYASQATTA